jgi:flagellar biosynthesis protein FlhA
MNQLLQKHVHELLGHEEVQQMIDRLARHSPKLVDTLVPDTIPMSALLKVLKGLLLEQLPVRDFRTIAEAIVASAAVNAEPSQLVESVRAALARSIVYEIFGNTPNLPVMTLAPAMEQMLMKPSGAQTGNEVTLDPGMAEQLQRSLNETAQAQELKGHPAVLLVPGPLRPVLAKFVRFSSHPLHVLSYNEIPDDKQVTIEATVG